MTEDYAAAMMAGYEAAMAGKSRKSCPYPKSKDTNEDGSDNHDNWRLRSAWKEGYSYLLPDGKTSIETVFIPHFGGPPRRDRKVDESTRKQQGSGSSYSYLPYEFEPYPFPFYKPENYIGDEHLGFDFKNNKELKKENVPTEWNKVFQSHFVHDGIYDVTNIPYHYIEHAEHLEGAITDEGLAFVQQYGHDNIYIANGYQVVGLFLFGAKPRPFDHDNVLGDFGRGACAIFTNCPKSILIVAEDD